MSMIFGWIATRAAGISWKAVLIGLAALGVIAAFGFGWLYVDHLSTQLDKTSMQLATETRKTAEAEARADAIKVAHDDQIERINTLEQQRSNIAVEVTALRATVQNLDIEEDLASDEEDKAKAALDRLNARNVELNRLLNDATGAAKVRPRTDSAGEARKAGTREALRRAVEALR